MHAQQRAQLLIRRRSGEQPAAIAKGDRETPQLALTLLVRQSAEMAPSPPALLRLLESQSAARLRTRPASAAVAANPSQPYSNRRNRAVAAPAKALYRSMRPPEVVPAGMA